MTECEHGQSLDQPCAECGRTGPPEPDPLTPEESYKLARWTPRNALTYPHPVDLIAMLDALRDMIASIDAEVARQAVAINRLERGQIKSPDPETVNRIETERGSVRNLADALEHWIEGDLGADRRLADEYDAWKARQRWARAQH